MSISTTQTKIQYVGNSTSTDFTLPSAFQLASFVRVTLITPSLDPLFADVSVVKALGTDYMVTGVGTEPGGKVVMAVAPTALQILLLEVDPTLTQGTTFPTAGPMPVKAMETALDKLTLSLQVAKEASSRSLKANKLDTGLNLEFPRLAGNAGKILTLNTAGNNLAFGPNVSDISSAVATTVAAQAAAVAAQASASAASSSAALSATSATASQAAATTAATTATAAVASIGASVTAASASATTASTGATNAAASATAAAASAASLANFRSGAGVPSNSLGLDNDHYLNTVSKILYKRAAGVYALAVDLSAAGGGGGGSVFRMASGTPSNALGVDGDSYLNSAAGTFYTRASGVYTLQYTVPTPPAAPTRVSLAVDQTDNTSDLNKPLSTAATNALATKAPSASGVPTGGTTGQILSKTSNTDYATAWIVAPTGGGTGVTDGDKGDIVVSGTGTVWMVDTGVVTNAQLATVPTATFKGRNAAGIGAPQDLTGTQATALLSAMVGDTGTGGTKGLVPAPVTGDATKYLKGDGTWATPAAGGGPANTDALTEGTTNLYFTQARAIASLLTGFAASAGTVAATDSILAAINKLAGNQTLKANLANPVFTGDPQAPTATPGDNDTSIANTAFVTAAIAAIPAGTTPRSVGSFTGTVITPGAALDQTWLYTGVTAQTFTGFGALAGLTNGMRFRIMGSNDDNTLTIVQNDATNGWLTNGTQELGRGQYVDCEYNSTLARVVIL